MDAVPEAEPGIAHAVPDDEAKLRLFSIVRDKAKDRLRFVADGCVDRSASYVIAVNTGRMPHVPDLEPPRIVRAMLGLGLPQVSMDLRSRALFDWRFQSQDNITRRSGKRVSVSTRIFLDPEPSDSPDYAGYEGISGVLSSGITPFCELWFDHSRFVLGDDFCLIHNPRAISRLPRGFLKVGREYWLDDDTGVLKCRVWFEDRARRGEVGEGK